MTTLQEYLDKKYPTKEERGKVERINEYSLGTTGGSLDLSDYVNIQYLDLHHNQLTSIDLSNCPNIRILNLHHNQLTNLDLSNCPNFENLGLFNSQLTNLDFLNALPNPEKLTRLMIHSNNIQPTDIAFFSRFKDKWLQALKDKITNTQQELDQAKKNKADKTAKIARLETKISELELAKITVNQQTQTEFSTQDKATQTDLTAEQITQLEQQNKQLKKNYKNETQIEVKEASIPFKIDNSTPQSKEEMKWEITKTGIEKETDLTRLANGAYWDIQIQTLQNNLLPANKQSIVLKNRLWQREQQIKAKIESLPKKS